MHALDSNTLFKKLRSTCGLCLNVVVVDQQF